MAPARPSNSSSLGLRQFFPAAGCEAVEEQLAHVIGLGGEVASVRRPARGEHVLRTRYGARLLGLEIQNPYLRAGAVLDGDAAVGDGLAVRRPGGIGGAEVSRQQKHGAAAIGGNEIDLFLGGPPLGK